MKYSKLLVSTLLAGQALLLANCMEMPWAGNRNRPPDMGPRRQPRENAEAIRTAQQAFAEANGALDMNTGIYTMPNAAPGFAPSTPMPYGYNSAPLGVMPMGQPLPAPVPAPSPFAPSPYTPVQTYDSTPLMEGDYTAQRGENNIPIPVEKPAISVSGATMSTGRRAPRDNPEVAQPQPMMSSPAPAPKEQLPWLSNTPREIERLEPVAPVQSGSALPPPRPLQPLPPSQAGTLAPPMKVEKMNNTPPAPPSRPVSIIPYSTPGNGSLPPSLPSAPPPPAQRVPVPHDSRSGVYRTQGEEIRLVPPGSAVTPPPAQLMPSASAAEPKDLAQTQPELQQRSWFSRATGGVFDKRENEPANHEFPKLNQVPAAPAAPESGAALLQRELEAERAAAHGIQRSLYNNNTSATAPVIPGATNPALPKPAYQGLNSYHPTEPSLSPVTLTPPPAQPAPLPPLLQDPNVAPAPAPAENYKPTYIPPPAYIVR